MKKILAMLLSFMLVMSASITAFGATTSDVDKTLKSSVKFTYGDKTAFDISESKDYYLYLIAGEYDENIEKSYFNSVKQALDGGEQFDIGTLGLIISNMVLSLEDPTDFEGYNVLDMFEKAELSEYDNMYTYMYAADIAFLFDFDALGKQLCDTLISKYTMGKGTDFWGGYGTSPDDLAVFIITLSAYYEEYEAYIKDALTLLKAYNTEAGYDNYGANANSTALALAAFVSADDEAAANDAYSKLMLFYNKETGGFNSSFDDILATKDAIFGLSYYWLLADIDDDTDDDENDNSTVTDNEEKPANPIVNIKDKTDTDNSASANKNNADSVKTENEQKTQLKSPATGAGTVAFALITMLSAGGVMLVSRKKEN
ncbi:MAG: NPXTG-anchored protein [Eubacterium sp.]|nr:NPXTG-anchored protein [Eubacterium sp.]